MNSHGQIWAQIVAVLYKNDKLLREDKWDTLKTEIINALQLGSDIHFPITRLVTIWRNERWRDMATCWCETSIGRDTFGILMWNWMISNRIDNVSLA